MIRTGEEYIDSIRDGREVWINGEKVRDIPTHPMFKPIVDIRARIYDMAHESETSEIMTYHDDETQERCVIANKPPKTKQDWRDKRTATVTVLDDIGGVVTRVGDETVGEMWSLLDGQDVLNEIDSSFSDHIVQHVEKVRVGDPFHVSANTDPKGDRSLWPHEQDPDMLLRVVSENDRGIVVRGAKFETAAAYANQAFVKPTIAEWDNQPKSEYAVGFLAHMGAPGMKFICRTGFATRVPAEDYPLSNKFDEVDTMIIFDDVEIPWEDVFFYRHTRAASFIRATLHRYSIFAFVQRHLRHADILLGTAYAGIQQTGVKIHQGVRERIAEIICYREAINAHLTTAIETAEESPGGLMMPNQATMFAGRARAVRELSEIMEIVRDLSGCQMTMVPSASTFRLPEAGKYLNKYFRIGDIDAEDRRRLLTFARDLLISDYAAHRLAFQLFAQSPPFSHRLAVYNNFDFAHVSELVEGMAGLSKPIRKSPIRG